MKVINNDEARDLVQMELKRAQQAGNLDTQEKFASKIFDYTEYVCNRLALDFKISPDSQKVYMSWRNVPWAPNLNKHPKLSWIYLHNHFISDAERLSMP